MDFERLRGYVEVAADLLDTVADKANDVKNIVVELIDEIEERVNTEQAKPAAKRPETLEEKLEYIIHHSDLEFHRGFAQSIKQSGTAQDYSQWIEGVYRVTAHW